MKEKEKEKESLVFLNLPFCTLLQNSHTITFLHIYPMFFLFVCFVFSHSIPAANWGAGHSKYNAALFAEWGSLSQMIKMANRFSAQSTMQLVLEEREAFDDDDDDDDEDVEEEASECEDHISDCDFEEEDEIEYQLAPK